MLKGTFYISKHKQIPFTGKIKPYERKEIMLRVTHDIPRYFGEIQSIDVDDRAINVKILKKMPDMSMEMLPHVLNQSMSTVVTTCHVVKVFEVLWEAIMKT
jgi:hypothetical protein